MHRHVLGQLGLIAAYLIIIRFTADVFAGGFPESVAARGLKQSVS